MFETPTYSALFEKISAVRAHRVAFLEEISSGGVSPVGVFERANVDPAVASMKVLPAIESLPDIGKVQTRRAFEELGIAEDAHIGDIAPEAIDGLGAALDRHAR